MRASGARRSRRGWAIGIGILALIGGGASWALSYTHHLRTVEEGALYRSGCRWLLDLGNAIRKTGARTVVSLVGPDEALSRPFSREEAFCRARGIRYISIPIVRGASPTTEDVRKFLDLALRPEARPVLLHCAQGVVRTGMMAAAYQMSVLGHDRPRALAEVLPFGHGERSIGTVRRFIEGYDPAARAVGAPVPAPAPDAGDVDD